MLSCFSSPDSSRLLQMLLPELASRQFTLLPLPPAGREAQASPSEPLAVHTPGELLFGMSVCGERRSWDVCGMTGLRRREGAVAAVLRVA